jgi:Rho family protein
MIGARSYRECSALNNEGVDEIFEAATRAAMLVRTPGATEGKEKSRRNSEVAAKDFEEDSKGCGCVIL